MDRDRVSITIKDDEIWEQRRARLKALELLNKPHRPAELKRHVNPRLHAAAKGGDVDNFIEALEKYSAEERVSLSDIIDMQSPSGNSLLPVAAGIENSDIFRALLEVVPDKRRTTAANFRGDTTLHVAARAGRIHAAELLLDCDGIAGMANDAGNTALHEAEERVSLSDMIDMQGPSGNSLLHVAAGIENSDILRALLEVTSTRRTSEGTPRYTSWRELLLDCDGNAGMANDAGNTELHEAVKSSHHGLTRLLLNRGSHLVYEENRERKCPLYLAVETGDLGILALLMEAVDRDDKFWWSRVVLKLVK